MFVTLEGKWRIKDGNWVSITKDQEEVSVGINIDRIKYYEKVRKGTMFILDDGDRFVTEYDFSEVTDWDIWELC